MPLEIEAKFRVEAHEPVRDRLRALEATFVSRVIEWNRIFDRPDGWLRARGRGLRVRSLTTESGATRSATLTVKGPLVGGRFKSREELEVEISDPKTTSRLLGLLGFVPILEYEKLRESWTFRDCRVELDQPACLGPFVEIEGPSEQAVQAVQDDLELGHLRHTQGSYVRMLLAHCEQHGLVDRVLRLP